MKKILVPLFSICLILSVLFSCKNTTKPKEAVNVNQFQDYVTSYTEQRISVGSDFKVHLKQEIDSSKVSEAIFSIAPSISGTVKQDGNVLTFIPKQKLEANKEYVVTLHLSKLYANVPNNLKDFTFNVKTKDLLFTVSLKSPKVYDKNWNYIEGSITASDVINTSKLKTLLKSNYNSKTLPINYDTSSAYASNIHFKIDSIPRFDNDKTVTVNWNGAVVNSTSKGSATVDIIGKNNFKVVDVAVISGDNQQIDISFSDPLKPAQNLKGLIAFKNNSKVNFTYKITNNVVTVYPSKSFKEGVTLEVFKGIKSNYGYALKEGYEEALIFEQPKPSVSFIKSGTILPDSDNLKINFQAVNLRAVDVTVYKVYKNNVLQFLQHNRLNSQSQLRYVGRPLAMYTVNLADKGVRLDKTNAFAINLADVITVEEGAMYRVKLAFNKTYSVYQCDGSVPKTQLTFGKKDVNTNSYDGGGYYYEDDYYDDDYNWRERNNPCKPSYFRNQQISTNILATNLGVIVKKGNNNNTFIAVTNILTTQPVAGAKVTLFNMQKHPIASAVTNNDGIVNLNITNQGYFVTVSKEKDVTYLKLDDGGSLSMSKFDVSGAKLQKGIKGYIYGERAVWRPGDQLFLTFILNDTANPIPDNHPLKFELINPQGKIIKREIQYKKPNNTYSYSPKTSSDALTGNWRLKVSVGGVAFNKQLKIETIKPNRLKIKLKTDNAIIKSNTKISGNVQVNWLHGAVAKYLKLDINGKFRESKTLFPKFSNYHFDDITRAFGTEEFKVLNGQLNAEGNTTFSVKPHLQFKAPGMMKVSLITKVYEKGGDFSTDVFTKKVSPFSSYVGVQLPKEEQSRSYLFTNKTYAFNVATVAENGTAVATPNLDVKVYKLKWRWWWSTSRDNLSYYDGTTHHEPYTSLKINTTQNGKGQFNLKIDDGDWGRYLIKITDPKSKHTTSQVVYFDWPSWYDKKKGGNDNAATMLLFTTNKEAYSINETAKVTFPSSEGARALITIENGTEVLNHFWVNTTNKQTEFEFPILATYTPNVFVNISLLQKHSQTKNDLPIRMYGSVPILVNNPETKLEPQVLLADELEPEQVAGIRVQEKNSKPMTYTIALVDDGLLDLTRFKTPNPWNTFYAKQSLGVKTWDVFDDVIGAYGGKINQILSIGGDETEAGSKNKKANRFKPMVIYLGPFNLEAGETKTHKVKIPKYVGSVRAMVVASNAKSQAYGSAQKTAFVRKPVMVLASLPRKITPQETVTLPVTVFAMAPHIKNVKVSLKPDPSFTIVGDKVKEVKFTAPDEKMAYFKLKINDFKGVGTIAIHASSGKEKASYAVEIDVLNPNPITTQTHDLVLKGEQEGVINFSTFGTQGTNTASIELSTLPPMNFNKRLSYLVQYPHGCIEQTTSSVFPQLFLTAIFDLTDKKKLEIQHNIKAGINRLSNFQLANGGLSYWQGNSSVDDWGTSYAGHFLLEAEKKGYVLPIGFKDKWVSYQKQTARNWRQNYSGYKKSGITQAYRLYTLCLANTPDLASMNRLRETNTISNDAKRRLASAYALIGKTAVANTIINSIVDKNYSRSYYSGYGSKMRNKAMALETYLLLNKNIEAIKLAKTIAESLSSNYWMSTQTTAYCLLAMSQYAIQNGSKEGVSVTYTLNNKGYKANTSKSLYTTDLDIKNKNNLKITNKGKGVVYAKVLVKGILPVGKEKIIQKNLSARVSYKSENGQLVNPANLSQGTNFIAQVKIENTTNEVVNNIALTQYLPSGWEIVNTRFTDFGDDNTETADFTDIRDDRVNYYFTLKQRETKTFSILLNASYLGNYYLPGIQAEAMYNNEYSVRTKGQWIQVVE